MNLKKKITEEIPEKDLRFKIAIRVYGANGEFTFGIYINIYIYNNFKYWVILFELYIFIGHSYIVDDMPIGISGYFKEVFDLNYKNN